MNEHFVLLPENVRPSSRVFEWRRVSAAYEYRTQGSFCRIETRSERETNYENGDGESSKQNDVLELF